MNLVLHGLESPKIDPLNSLRFPLREIGDRDRVDIIMTNPPFGGEEERGILGNFPEDKQTSETALLFLQLIMRKLKRHRRKPGRAAVVVPNGTLFGDGICARIKEELLKDFNLHTIVRLPNGVFAPYTSIPTNLLFFDRSHPTEEVWYYEQPLPEGRKNYTKTQPIQFEEFAGCLGVVDGQAGRERTRMESARVRIARQWLQPRPQESQRRHRLRASPARTTRRRYSQKRAAHHGNHGGDQTRSRCQRSMTRSAISIRLGQVLKPVSRPEQVDPEKTYRILVRTLVCRGLVCEGHLTGSQIRTDRVYRVEEGDFVYNRLFAWKGSFARRNGS